MLASVATAAPTPNLITAPSEFQLDAQPTRAGCVRRTHDMTEITACLCGSSVLPSQQNAQTAVQCVYHGCETSWVRIIVLVCYGIAYSWLVSSWVLELWVCSLLGFIPVVYVDYWDKSQHKVSPVPIRAVSPFMVWYYPPMTLYWRPVAAAFVCIGNSYVPFYYYYYYYVIVIIIVLFVGLIFARRWGLKCWDKSQHSQRMALREPSEAHLTWLRV